MNNLFLSLKNYISKQNTYLIYERGNSPILLSAPHGGDRKPISIPRRTYGNRSRDIYTKDLIIQLVHSLEQKPYYIYSNIHRSKIDLNRDIVEGCQGDKEMEKLWHTWEGTLDLFQNEIRYYHKKGLYIDIHSHNNHDKFMIGYGISVKDYLHLLNDDGVPTKNSTMHELKEYNKDKYISEHSILFGRYSIFRSLKSYGFKVLIPDNDKEFLNGGYNIEHNKGNGIGSMQIEIPISVLKNDFKNCAYALKESIELFQKKFLTEF